MEVELVYQRFVKPKKTKKKKPKTDQQKKEALRKLCVGKAKEISKIIEGNKCQYCGVGREQRMIHSHHIFHEGLFTAMSADVDNLISLCASHHQGGMYMRSNDGFNFHNSPRESTEWLMENMPERYATLKARSLKLEPIFISFWKRKKEELTLELAKLKKNY
jgi:hypothetical protein